MTSVDFEKQVFQRAKSQVNIYTGLSDFELCVQNILRERNNEMAV